MACHQWISVWAWAAAAPQATPSAVVAANRNRLVCMVMPLAKFISQARRSALSSVDRRRAAGLPRL